MGVARRGPALVVVATILLGLGTAAGAEAPTRDEYVEALERVCKPDALATQRVTKGTKADIKAERFDAAAQKTAKAASIFGSTVDEISKAPRPSADLTKLRKWFAYLRRQESYLREIRDQLRQGHAIKVQKLTGRFIHNGNLANYEVLAFGFDYCSFKFSRYG
jgi:hypothetical protein